MVELRCCTFEILAAACTEHDITAKNLLWGNEGDVIVKVTGYLDDVELGVDSIEPQRVAFS